MERVETCFRDIMPLLSLSLSVHKGIIPQSCLYRTAASDSSIHSVDIRF